MSFIVPFDGSALAKAGLVRACEFANALDERVLAVSVVPKGNARYARERGWIGEDEEFDLQSAVATLRGQVTELCPRSDFRYQVAGRHASPGTIAKRLRRAARQADAAMVFIGSENAGRIVSSLASIGSKVAADEAFDVVIVRHRSPEPVTERGQP